MIRSQKQRERVRENEHVLSCLRGREKGPTVIFMGGIHGNEPSGVSALDLVMDELRPQRESLRGTVYALVGNPEALQLNRRFVEEDLNRLWTKDRMDALMAGNLVPSSLEEHQQLYLFRTIRMILENESGPFYFFDLHTTSCQTIPFLTVNDMRINRKFAEQYPVPMILGIEEYLNGPVLSYINELGYVSFGYEAGQHTDPQAIRRQKAFICLSLAFTGIFSATNLSLQHYHDFLKNEARGVHDVYEMFYRHEISEGEEFTMKPGFVNFSTVRKETVLAEVNGNPVRATQRARIFMPLYQDQGNDGYFLIRRISRMWLRLSDVLRKLHMDRLFALLPGIHREAGRKDVLIVDRRIARFLAREIFHLFGYRSKQLDKNHLRMKNRETTARTSEYADAPWLKKPDKSHTAGMKYP